MTDGPNSPDPIYNGRYELRNQIARGGTAQVYLARDLMLDRPVALKVLFPELSSDHSFVERFRREAQAAANLSHPNIVPVFDWGESENTYFIVMEYVDGEPLSSIIRTQAPLEAAQAASIAGEIARALSYAHRHGVVHRDVKPGNVLITADGEVKVTDFGIARAIGHDEQVTQTGLVMGTATYFSPEQAQGLAVDGRSDIYSLGVVLHEMLTGKPPFSGDNPVTIAYQHVREMPPTPRSLEPSIPVALEAIVLQAMAKLPAERYASAEEMRADLERFVRGQTVLARPPGAAAVPPDTTAVTRQESEQVVPPPPPPPRSTTPVWATAAVVLLLAIAAIVVFGGRSLGWFGGAPYFRVPDVKGLTVPRAKAVLTAADLKMRTQVVKATVTAAGLTDTGKVVGQQPSPPTTVRRGSSVLVQVAGKAPIGTLPTVTNKTLPNAERILKQAKFAYAVHYVPATDPTQKQNTVISESPPGGGTEPFGTIVNLNVVKGTKLVMVPSFTGDDEAQAGAAITKAGLNVAPVQLAFSATVPSGQVISSTPPSNTQVAQGTPVTIVVSKGPGVTVPSLLGESEGQAESELQNDGLSYTVGGPIPTQIDGYIGNVAYQHPAEGTTVAPGTPVQIRLGACSTACQATSTTSSTTTTTTTLPGGGTVPTAPPSS